MKTPAQVRKEFEERGISLSSFAMERGIPPAVISDVLRGKTKGKRGMAHTAYVALGLKPDPKLKRAA